MLTTDVHLINCKGAKLTYKMLGILMSSYYQILFLYSSPHILVPYYSPLEIHLHNFSLCKCMLYSEEIVTGAVICIILCSSSSFGMLIIYTVVHALGI